MLARKLGRRTFQQLAPKLQLRLHRLTTGMLAHSAGPGLERAGLARQPRSFSTEALLVSPLQILQQNAPGHPVHHQMVDHQQQTLATVGHIHQQAPQQWAVGQVQAALRLLAERLQRLSVHRLGTPEQRTAQRCFGMFGMPGSVRFMEAQTQCVVMFDQGLQGRFECLRIQGLARLQQQ